mmetsp:Transcript_39653/g.61885  ORF Transcript_39653/g.61885 Transcript_39653/m.61885 type:complete len:91 (+) Transcript_39653:593-865(+)
MLYRLLNSRRMQVSALSRAQCRSMAIRAEGQVRSAHLSSSEKAANIQEAKNSAYKWVEFSKRDAKKLENVEEAAKRSLKRISSEPICAPW